MAYDAVSFVEALEAPSIRVPPEGRPWWQRLFGLHKILGPVTYEGRVLSHPEWMRFEARWLESWEGELSTEEDLKLIEDYLEACGIPKRALDVLPAGAVAEALEEFLACQSRANGVTEEELGATMELLKEQQHAASSPSGSTTSPISALREERKEEGRPARSS